MMNSIAATAMNMQNNQLAQAVSLSVMKKGMEGAEAQALGLLEMLPQTSQMPAPAAPPSNCIIDVYA